MVAKKDKDNTADTKSVQRERQKLLNKAQRFVYPVGVTRKKITIISAAIFGVIVAIFITLSAILIYVVHDESRFTYQVSKILPFPIGRVDNNLVTYEEYLFELRPNVHFLVEKEQIDPDSSDGIKRIEQLRHEALKNVYQNALAENLAKKHGVTVTDEEIDQRIAILKTQASDFSKPEASTPDQANNTSPTTTDPRFEEILAEFYDWSIKDLERVLNIQILKSKLPPKIDTATRSEAEELRTRLISNPKTFSSVAKQISEDPESSKKGGDLGFLNAQNSVAYPKVFLDTANSLQDQQVSDVIQTDFGYHILLRTETNNKNEPRISHILLKFKQPNELLAAQLKSANVQKFDSIVD